MEIRIADYADYLEVIKRNFGKSRSKLHCSICGLEGCKRSNHQEWDSTEYQRELGGNDL